MAPRRLPAAVLLLALTAGVASAAPVKQGGIFSVGMTGASVQIDPQLSYVSTAWWLEYATAAKLFNYPDRSGQAGGLLRPEVAASYAVSRDGRTYTFTMRKGFRFSDGSPVTARNFAYAVTRAKDPDLESPAGTYISEVRTARAKGGKLVMRLSQPDPSLLSKLALPFFQATSTKLPLKTEVTGSYPSAGPYYFARNDVNELTSLRRNPYWKGARPRHLTGVDVFWNGGRPAVDVPFDLAPVQADEASVLAQRFGVNRTRFWVMPSSCIAYIAFNNESGLFARNAALRRAVNWGLDRTDYFGGSYAYRPWTHLLPPLTPGSVTAPKRQPYGVHANPEKARKIASGHFGDGKIAVAYRSSGTISSTQVEVVKRDLVRLGFAADRIEMKGFAGAQIYEQMGMRGNRFDMFVSVGYCSDFPDQQSLSLFGVRNTAFERKIAAASKLPEPARGRALGQLDVRIMRKLAPVAPMGVYNNLYLFSDRVNPRSLVYSSAYQDWSIPALTLK